MDKDKNEVMNAATLASVTTTLVFIQAQLAEIKADVNRLTQNFASKEELSNTAKITEDRLARLEGESRWWRWASPTAAAIIAVIIEYLFLFYINHATPVATGISLTK